MVHAEKKDGVLQITLDSPKGNMLTMEDIALLSARVNEAREDDSVGGILLTGAGAAFCAGLSAEALREVGAGVLFEAFNKLTRELFLFPKPVVAAVNGHSIGGGLLLQCTADYCLMARHPRIKTGLPEVRLGLVVDRAMVRLLSFHAVSPKALQVMLLEGRFYTTDELLAMGFGDRVVEPTELVEAAREKLTELMASPAEAYSATKKLLKEGVL